MSVDMESDRLVLLSVVLHVQAALTAAGWANTSDWVVEGHVDDYPDSRSPIVAVWISETQGTSFELGNSHRLGLYFVDIELRAVNNSQLQDLATCIRKNVDNIKIIDFNTAMPGDDGYDADAQTLTRGRAADNVRSRIVDTQDHTARVSFILEEGKPL